MNMMNKCVKFHKDSPSDKKVKFNLPSSIELLKTADFVYNVVQKPYVKRATSVAHLANFSFEFFFMKFSQKMPLYFFNIMVQKSQKWPKTQIKGVLPWGSSTHLWRRWKGYPARPEANRDRPGPKFRVQQTVLWPIHWIQQSWTEPHRPWSPYLGRLATLSMTVDDSFVRWAKRARWQWPHFFSFSFPRETYQEGSGGFWKKFWVQFFFFLLRRFGVVYSWTCHWNTYKSLQKTVVFDLSCWKNEHGDPQFLSHIWNSHETKDRYWKNQPISR